MTNRSYNIAVIGGDGTGPEVTVESIKVLNAAAKAYGFELNYTNYDLGGEHYQKTGEILNDDTIARLRTADAILLGAIGHP
ncbi:MAG: isocitrate/isopropylmalate family dehydrogenase, partial [Desulfosudaceae bacterium]